jgi:uncharacterized protein YndB with AHSA1/START domain
MTSKEPIAKAQIAIRRPVAEVYEAFVNPEVTTKFWFTKSTGRLEKNAKVKWTWEMYNVSTDVEVKVLEENKRVVVQWGMYGDTNVEWSFTSQKDGSTFVTIMNSDFHGDLQAQAASAVSSTEGFALVLAGAKAFLEHNIQLNLVADHAPLA